MDCKHFLIFVFIAIHFALNGANDVTVTEGDEVRLNCERNTRTTVNWKYQRHPDDNSVYVYIYIRGHLYDEYKPKFVLNITDFTLTINNVAVDDSGVYSCIEDSGLGETHDIQLTVVRLTTAEEGDQAQLPCDRNNDNPVDWRYQRALTDYNPYIVRAGRLLDDHITRMQLNPVDYTLTINKVVLNDSGFYSCIEDSGIGDFHFMKLIVAHIMTATEGDLVSLKCGGTVDAPVDWRYRKHLTENNAYIAVGGRLLDEFKPRIDLNLVGHTLSINSVTVDDSGFYSCCIEGSGETHLVKLNVVRLTRAKEGDQARLRCVRSIDKPVDWRYQRDLTDYNPYIVIGGHVVEEFKDRFQLNPVEYTLTVNNVSLNDSGFYSCIEDSGIGDIHLVKLVVVKRSSQQSTLQINDGSSVIGVLSVSTGLLAIVVVCLIVSKFCRGRLKAIYQQFKGGQERQHLITNACGDQPTDRRPSPVHCEMLRVSGSEGTPSLSSAVWRGCGCLKAIYRRFKGGHERQNLNTTAFDIDALEVNLEQEYGDIRPLTSNQLNALDVVSHSSLVKFIDLDHDLLDHLESTGCITSKQREYVKKPQTVADRNGRLLDILRRKSIRDFNQFMHGLENNGQKHVALAIVAAQGMLEVIIIKAAGQLLRVFNKLSGGSDVKSLTILSAVCYSWWTTLASRHLKTRLRKQFDYANGSQARGESRRRDGDQAQPIVRIEEVKEDVAVEEIETEAVDRGNRA